VIDQSLYPDREPPRSLDAAEDKADYLARVCGAFDFGISPEAATLDLLRGWREVFDRFPLAHSPAYHALRALFGWAPVDSLTFLREPLYRVLDAEEGREDGCEDRV
jgi:hypothetical protein